MKFFAGVDLQKLQEDDLLYYVEARDKLLRQISTRLAVLQMQQRLVDVTGEDCVAAEIIQLPELQERYIALQDWLTKIKYHLQNFENLRKLEAAGKYTYENIIQYMPDIGVRKILNNQGLIILNTHDILDSADSHRLDQAYDLQDLYKAMLAQNWQNVLDYLNKLSDVSIKCVYKDNEGFLVGFKISAYLDLYLLMREMPQNKSVCRYLNLIQMELKRLNELLINMQDSTENNACALQNRYKLFCCFSANNTKSPDDPKKQQVKKLLHRYF